MTVRLRGVGAYVGVMSKTIVRAERAKVVRLNRAVGEFGNRHDIGRGQVDRPIVRLHLLGLMRATTYLGDNVVPRGKKARAILGYLCLAAGKRVPRARLATMLWDRVPSAQARTSFRQALREISTAFGPLAGELILGDRETLRLNTSLCWIDALAMLAPASPSNPLRSNLAALCAGELLEELDGVSTTFDQWLLGERTRFTEHVRALLEGELQDVDLPSVDARQRAAIARRLIAFEPTHERASRTLMRALHDMGERAQALREYARCREAMSMTLDVAPSPETNALYEAIRNYSGREDADKKTSSLVLHPHEEPSPELVPASRGRMRVGVLPFLATGSTNEDNLSFSLSQEIAAALARFRWFDVIAPVSMMRQHSSDFVTEGVQRKELDYVVDGALSRNGEKFRISVRLLDLSQYARPVWSDCFELSVGQLHQLDDLVTARIVGRIDPVILFIEGQPKRRERYGATGLLLLAMPLIYSMKREKFEKAGQLINRALEIDPNDAMVNAWAAYWHMWHVGQGWTQDADRTLSTAQDLCLRAIRIDPDNAEAMGIYAHTCSWKKDFDQALHFFDRSLRLNPNLAYIWALSAATYCYVGDPDAALKRLDRYRDLAPFDPYFCFFENAYTIAYTFKRDYAQAAIVGRRVVRANPEFTNSYKPLLASLGYLGLFDEAAQLIEQLLSREPNFTVQQFGEVYPFRRDSDRKHYMAGLRLAGVPES